MPEAVIDLGTNSALLLVGDIENGKIREIDQQVLTVRLGQDLVSTGEIQPEAVKRCMHAVLTLMEKAGKLGVRSTQIVGTHVFRAARNGQSVARQIQRATGCPVEILSEREEALRSFLGATWGRGFEETFLLTDIGGGSTELILGSERAVENVWSLPLGAVTLTERYAIRSPLTDADKEKLEEEIKTSLSALPNMKTPSSFVAVGGTATTLAALALNLDRYDAQQVDGHRLSHLQVNRLYNTLSAATLEEKRNRLAFYPDRADIIVAGTAILSMMMHLFSLPFVTVSDRGLRHGILLRNAIEMK